MQKFAEKLISQANAQRNYQSKDIPADVYEALLEVLEHNASAERTKRVHLSRFVAECKAEFGFAISLNTLRAYMRDRMQLASWDQPDISHVRSLKAELHKSKKAAPKKAARKKA